MATTRDKILKTSLGLFNKRGIDGVSMRDIALKVNIRVGNLNYYFPTKNDIVHALCIELIDKVDAAIEGFFARSDKPVFEILYDQTEMIFSIQQDYGFIFTKRYAEILTSLPPVQKHYRETLKNRFDEWLQLHTLLVQQNLATPQLVEDSYPLSYILNTLALFWHQETEIYFPEYTDEQKRAQGLSVLFHAYKPYLTTEGLNQLMPLLKPLERY